jgi:hypothetical protein
VLSHLNGTFLAVLVVFLSSASLLILPIYRRRQ